MYKLEDYESRMVFDGKRNNREVKIICEVCGKEHWARWQRVRKGQGRFCSLDCYNEYQRATMEHQYLGKENAKEAFDKRTGRWNVYWYDEKGKRHTTSYARWWWEQNNGKIPTGYRASYKDGNPENVSPENIILISPEEYGKQISERLKGHGFSKQTLKKMSKAKIGKKFSKEHCIKIGNNSRKRWAEGQYDDIHVGKNNPRWKGGVRQKYPDEFYEIRSLVLSRDKRSCRICHKRTQLGVHHIDGNIHNNSLDNLITFCRSCHAKVHFGSRDDNNPMFTAFNSALKF